jgi:hypothetical protein
VAIQVKIGLRIECSIKELQRARARDERARAGLGRAESKWCSKESREMLVDIEGVKEVRVHSGMRGTTRAGKTDERGWRAEPENNVV